MDFEHTVDTKIKKKITTTNKHVTMPPNVYDESRWVEGEKHIQVEKKKKEIL